MVLYNKYRPSSLDLICGQEHIKKILTQQVKKNSLSNAYLFIGPAGTGKTTLARIFCSMVNCSTGMSISPDQDDRFVKIILSGQCSTDVIEIDAATNGRLDDMRELRERVRFAPMEMPKKIWIIDECHKLTTDSWQALLKVLEEPPSHVMFILCTTDPTDIPDTILTRSMVLQFRSFSAKDIFAYLQKIVVMESKQISEECLRIVAHSARGSMRQALSTLDKVMLLDPCTPEEIAKVVSVSSRSSARDFVRSALNGKFPSGLKASSEVISSGVSAQDFLEEVANYIHDLIICDLPGYDLFEYGYSNEDVSELKRIFGHMKEVFRDPVAILQSYIQLLDVGHKMTVYNIQSQFHVDAIWVNMYRKGVEGRIKTT